MELWICENSWIQISETYKKKKYNHNSPMININNLYQDLQTLDMLVNFIEYWKIHILPIELHIYFLSIEKKLINEYIGKKFPLNNTESYLEYMTKITKEELICKINNFEFLLYALDNNIITKNKIFLISSKYGNENFVKYLLKNCECNNNIEDALRMSCKYSHLNVFKYLCKYYKKNNRILPSYNINILTTDNNILWSKIILVEGGECSIFERLLSYAVDYNQINIIKFLINDKYIDCEILEHTEDINFEEYMVEKIIQL